MKDEKEERTNKVKAAKRGRLLPGLKVGDGFMPHPFDLEFGTRTSGLIAGRHLKSGHRNDRYSTAYYAVAPSVIQGLIVLWRRSRPIAPIDEFTFVDLGAGMGRAMLLASEYRFRSVVGVELNPTLARIARKNAALWRKAGKSLAPMRVVCRDAEEFEFPAGPCVAFLFNPFNARMMRRLLGSLAKSFAGRPRQLDILYANNEQEKELERQAGFTRLFQGQVKRSRTDAIADHRILANQPEGEYASSNWEDCSIWRWDGKTGSREWEYTVPRL